MKEQTLEKPTGVFNKILMSIIIISIIIGTLLYVLSKFDFDILFAIIMSIMAVVHLGLLIILKKWIYCIPAGFYLFVATTFYFKYTFINPMLPAVFAGFFFALFIYILITRKFPS